MLQWFTQPTDPETKSGSGFNARKCKRNSIHWVAVPTAEKAECRLYENIVDEEKGKLNADGTLNLNPNSDSSARLLCGAFLKDCEAYDSFQFMRNGYFCVVARTAPRSIRYLTALFP